VTYLLFYYSTIYFLLRERDGERADGRIDRGGQREGQRER
jgi:hypothetical protein